MTFQESETIELKEIVVEDIKKEIIAFANSAGGTLYVGVADDRGSRFHDSENRQWGSRRDQAGCHDVRPL